MKKVFLAGLLCGAMVAGLRADDAGCDVQKEICPVQKMKTLFTECVKIKGENHTDCQGMLEQLKAFGVDVEEFLKSILAAMKAENNTDALPVVLSAEATEKDECTTETCDSELNGKRHITNCAILLQVIFVQ